MPPRKHRRKIEQQDLELDQGETNSRWAHILNHKDKDQEDQQELQPKKEIFNFDFSKEHLLRKQKSPPKKEQPKIVLTPEQQAELDRRLEKERIEREEKEKVKKQKKQEKKVIVDKQKQQERIKREQQQKTAEKVQQIIKSNKSNSDSKKILLTLFIILILLGLLQYQKDIYARLSKFRLNTQINYYQVLQTSSGASDAQLRNQYKRLVTKYHPDKNPNCHSCKERFNGVMQAWQVLGNPQKRQHYDQNSGFVNQIKSATLTLTPNNYEWLLSDSPHIWIIEVYDSTSEYCHFFASFWQDFAERYKGFVRTARIDVWQQPEMKSYIPFKFQIFPALYSLHHGQEVLCQLDFERPMRSLELCAEQRVEQLPITKIKDRSEAKHETKLSVIVGGAVKLSTPIKLIHSRFSDRMAFFQMNDKSHQVAMQGQNARFQLSVAGSKTIYHKYRQFLEGTIVQEKWSCQVNEECKETGCLLLLDGLPQTQQQHPLPLLRVRDRDTFLTKIQEIKNLTGMHEKFDVGHYQDGKIELGYFSEIGQLNPDNGEVIDLPCRAETYLEKLQRYFGAAKGLLPI